jgi:hypothetical protein
MSKQFLQNQFLKLEYSTDYLRITGLYPFGRENIFADLNNQPPITTAYGDFHFRGGHRLWHAPEAMPRTYIPDPQIAITAIDHGVKIETEIEPGTLIRKRIEIRLEPDRPSVTLIHTLINTGLWAVELAPWAITQFRLGGTVILPMPIGNAGLLPNRQFSLWSYASVNDPRLKWDNEFLLFKADALPPFKIGYFNPHGWLAYSIDGMLFRKTFEASANALYPDNNCNAEMYGNDQFVELESLAPLAKLNPMSEVSHTETWELWHTLDPLSAQAREKLTAWRLGGESEG